MDRLSFVKELEAGLPKSSGDQRKKWAELIVIEDIELTSLNKLFFANKEITSRFLWLCSDVGLKDSNRLSRVLPFVLKNREIINYNKKESTIANYFKIAGVPSQIEGETVDLLFSWISSASFDLTTKSRSLHVLNKIIKKYPALKNELKLVLENQIQVEDNSYTKLAKNILLHL